MDWYRTCTAIFLDVPIPYSQPLKDFDPADAQFLRHASLSKADEQSAAAVTVTKNTLNRYNYHFSMFDSSLIQA